MERQEENEHQSRRAERPADSCRGSNSPIHHGQNLDNGPWLVNENAPNCLGLPIGTPLASCASRRSGVQVTEFAGNCRPLGIYQRRGKPIPVQPV